MGLISGKNKEVEALADACVDSVYGKDRELGDGSEVFEIGFLYLNLYDFLNDLDSVEGMTPDEVFARMDSEPEFG